MRPQLNHTRSLLALLFATILLQPAWSAECAMKTALILKESQGGFAGTTGTVWTFKPDCSFTVVRFVNEKLSEPHRQGRLTLEQQSALSTLLSAAMPTLPARIGEAPPVNPHQISIEYDGKASVLEVSASASGELAKKIVEISEAAKRVTGGAEQK